MINVSSKVPIGNTYIPRKPSQREQNKGIHRKTKRRKRNQSIRKSLAGKNAQIHP
jgi:hypothetical protein